MAENSAPRKKTKTELEVERMELMAQEMQRVLGQSAPSLVELLRGLEVTQKRMSGLSMSGRSEQIKRRRDEYQLKAETWNDYVHPGTGKNGVEDTIRAIFNAVLISEQLRGLPCDLEITPTRHMRMHADAVSLRFDMVIAFNGVASQNRVVGIDLTVKQLSYGHTPDLEKAVIDIVQHIRTEALNFVADVIDESVLDDSDDIEFGDDNDNAYDPPQDVCEHGEDARTCMLCVTISIFST